MAETNPVQPLSPYGVSKLAAEQLCFLYFKNFGVPAVSLRFFTVYGPSQRPDMAFHKFFKAMAEDREISVFGDGQQTRDFTFVDDIVQANLAALVSGKPGETYNIGGGHRKKLADVIRLMEGISRTKARVRLDRKAEGGCPRYLGRHPEGAAGPGLFPEDPSRRGARAGMALDPATLFFLK